MALQPLGPAADVDKLHRFVALQGLANPYTSHRWYAGQIHVFLAPLCFVRQEKADDSLQPNSGQSYMCFFGPRLVFGDHYKFLTWSHKHRRPAGKRPGQTNLYRSADVKRRKMLGRSSVKEDGALSLLLNDLGGRQETKFFRFGHLGDLQYLVAQKVANFDQARVV